MSKGVVPGDELPMKGEPGQGTYKRNDSLYASIFGEVIYHNDESGKNIVSVIPVSNKPAVVAAVGDIVLAQVYNFNDVFYMKCVT